MTFLQQKEYWSPTITSIYFYPEFLPFLRYAISQIVQWILTKTKTKNPNQTKKTKNLTQKNPQNRVGEKKVLVFISKIF